MKKLSVVILNWNGKHFLEQFLPALIDSLPDFAELVVADNNSTDDSIPFLKQNFPSIRLILNGENGGFSKGYNQALNQIDATYFCLLNSDILVDKNWIAPIIEMMDADDSIAAVQPKLRSYSDRKMFEYAGASGGFIDKFGYPFCRGRVFDKLENDNGQYDTPMQIFWATGAALFVRRDVFLQLNGLDEDFFAHMEEIDFCWRINNSGYKIMVNPQSVVYHVGGGTLPKNNSFKTFLNFRNNLFLLLKNLPKNRLFITFFCRFFLDQIAAFVFLLKGQFSDFKAVYKAIFAFLNNYNKMKAKRGKILDSAFHHTYPKSIVFQHYFFKKNFFDGSKLFK